MTMRPLIIDNHARAEVARVIAHAEAHHYRKGQPVPGDDPAFVVYLNTYRCVFTFTDTVGILWRHLSISVPERYPNPAAAFMIADLFGFTGWDQHTIDRPPDSWLLDINDVERYVMLAQPVRSTTSLNG